MITKIYESVFPLPIREDAVRRQIRAMGRGYIAHPEHQSINPSFEAFLNRQRARGSQTLRLEFLK